ncbi:MAG TPA: hypothetical protein VFA21_11600, partial [Pyrinomonadaceae bacterium]|nr:hypothetical protein [Pyrinomonadaceae bacterium]
ETAHRLIEDEFYEVERFSSRADFLRKAGAYNLWFNVARRSAQTAGSILGELFMRKLDSKLLWGYDVIPHPSSARW